MNYSSLVSLMILVSAALFFLPAALSSALECLSCGSSLSPEQCNATQTSGALCSLSGQGPLREFCIALTAEFTNGTKIGIRGCRAYSVMAGCNSSVACNSENETMPQGARFKRCIAECCINYHCNQNLYPMLPPEPEPSSSYTTVMATSSIINPTGMTTDKKPEPTSKAAALVRSYQWLFVSVLALFLYVM